MIDREKLNRILDLIKDDIKDLEIVLNNGSDRGVVIDAIDNLLYAVVEFKKAYDLGRYE